MSRPVLCLGGSMHGRVFDVVADGKMRHAMSGPRVLTIHRIHIGGQIREVAVQDGDDVDALVHAYLLELFDAALARKSS